MAANAAPDDAIVRPVFIVSSPRSGSSLLFLTMAEARNLHTIGGESHSLIETIPGLHPAQRGWTSNVLDEGDATPEIVDALRTGFRAALRDRDGRPPAGPARMLEKTPKNSLRTGLLERAFPDADFVFLYRDVRETLSSMIEAWTSGRFRTYPRLPGWTGLPWSLLLVPGWRDLAGQPLPVIVARQWATTMTLLLDRLEALPAGRVVGIGYDNFLAAPQDSVAALCARLGIEWDRALPATLPLSPTVVTPPRAGKWARHEGEIDAVWPIVADVDARARAALAHFA